MSLTHTREDCGEVPASQPAFLGRAQPGLLSRKAWQSFWASKTRAQGGRLGDHPCVNTGKAGLRGSWSTSFDSRQWRQLLTPALRVLTPQESRILMPMVASLPRELLLPDQGALASVTGWGWGPVSEISSPAHGKALPPSQSHPHPKAHSPLILPPPLYPAPPDPI